MRIIYHSRGAFPARLAAALHTGRLPAAPPRGSGDGLESALTDLGGAAALQGEGLWAAGALPDGSRVYAVGRASRPDVVCRAFRSLAELAGIAAGSYELHSIGPVIAWDDLWVRALRLLGLHGLAHRALLEGIRRHWAAAAKLAATEVESSATPADAPAQQQPAPPLRVVYQCYGSAHSSITAASLHLGHLPLDRRPGPREILHQPLFDRAENTQVGRFRLMGTDEWGNEVYALGLAGGRHPMSRALVDFLALFGPGVTRYRFEDTLQHAGVILRVGGYASRALGLVALGRPLCALGVWLKYQRFAAHVRRVRQELSLTPPALSDIIDEIPDRY